MINAPSIADDGLLAEQIKQGLRYAKERFVRTHYAPLNLKEN